MKKKTFPLAKVYQLMEPGPVVMVTTAHKNRTNIMTMAWHTMLEFEPPLIGCVISEANYSFRLVQESKECVINIPTAHYAEQVVRVGSMRGSRIDKFKEVGFTQEQASVVGAPLIKECYANLECKLYDAHMIKKYNFFIFEVVKAWVAPSKKRHRTLHHVGDGLFIIDGTTIKLPFKSL